MAQMTLCGSGDLRGVAVELDDAVNGSGASVELVTHDETTVNDVLIITKIYEKYYMRNSSRASLTVQLVGYRGRIRAFLAGSGGGNGTFFGFSWGAEENFVESAAECLRRLGFAEC